MDMKNMIQTLPYRLEPRSISYYYSISQIITNLNFLIPIFFPNLRKIVITKTT